MGRIKGIILAGGKGTRLYPMTHAVSKQLLPVYDKPMIYYPLSTLMLGGIVDVMVISTPEDIGAYEKLLGDGSKIGMHISYGTQDKPAGIAQAFLIAEDYIGNDKVCLILGDNVFFGQNLTRTLNEVIDSDHPATVFACQVGNPKDFGVVEFDEEGKVLSIEEKPQDPKSNYAVPGLYFYDSGVVEIAKKIKPSKRGELEITAVNNEYLKRGELYVKTLGRGMAWLDTGTPDGILKAATFVEAIQSRQGMYVSCIEEIAWRRGFITTEQLRKIGEELSMTDYGKYILSVAEGTK